jgi:hypothetical protein
MSLTALRTICLGFVCIDFQGGSIHTVLGDILSFKKEVSPNSEIISQMIELLVVLCLIVHIGRQLQRIDRFTCLVGVIVLFSYLIKKAEAIPQLLPPSPNEGPTHPSIGSSITQVPVPVLQASALESSSHIGVLLGVLVPILIAVGLITFYCLRHCRAGKVSVNQYVSNDSSHPISGREAQAFNSHGKGLKDSGYRYEDQFQAGLADSNRGRANKVMESLGRRPDTMRHPLFKNGQSRYIGLKSSQSCPDGSSNTNAKSRGSGPLPRSMRDYNSDSSDERQAPTFQLKRPFATPKGFHPRSRPQSSQASPHFGRSSKRSGQSSIRRPNTAFTPVARYPSAVPGVGNFF